MCPSEAIARNDRRFRRRPLWREAVAAAILALSSAAAAAGDGSPSAVDVIVEHAEILAGIPDRSTATAFVTFFNGSTSGLDLVELRSDVFATATMHKQKLRSRRHTDPGTLIVPPHSELTMQPDGVHVRLSELKRKLRPGDRIPLSLVFADGLVIPTEAVVLPASAAATHHDHGEADG